MSTTPNYAYTPEQVTAAFTDISNTLFSGITAETVPRMLLIAGQEGTGKTWLLEKSLLPSGRYSNYVRLYLPEYREKHPQYAQMIKFGGLHAYQHTEAFVREVCGKIFAEAFTRNYNIIMECAFDSIDFATFPPLATAKGYQFDIHIVACNQEFAHLSCIKRALKSLETRALERFVLFEATHTSMSNARGTLPSFEAAAKAVSGSQINLYERGLGALNERTLRAQSTYTKAADGTVSTSSTLAPYTYGAYLTIINNHVFSTSERDEMVKECHLALSRTQAYIDQIPDVVYNDLYAYIVKYVYR